MTKTTDALGEVARLASQVEAWMGAYGHMVKQSNRHVTARDKAEAEVRRLTERDAALGQISALGDDEEMPPHMFRMVRHLARLIRLADQDAHQAAADLRHVDAYVCGLCLAGVGSECHVPGCMFWMHDVPTGDTADALRSALEVTS